MPTRPIVLPCVTCLMQVTRWSVWAPECSLSETLSVTTYVLATPPDVADTCGSINKGIVFCTYSSPIFLHPFEKFMKFRCIAAEVLRACVVGTIPSKLCDGFQSSRIGFSSVLLYARNMTVSESGASDVTPSYSTLSASNRRAP